MKIVAMVLSVCLFVPVASAQYWPDWDSPEFDLPSRSQSQDPALDQWQAEMDREQARRTMRALELRAQQEMMGSHAYSACGSITNNPAAREECRRNRAPW